MEDAAELVPPRDFSNENPVFWTAATPLSRMPRAELEALIKTKTSFAAASRYFREKFGYKNPNSVGRRLKKRCEKEGIDISHFEHKNFKPTKERAPTCDLRKLILATDLLEECARCGQGPVFRGKPLVIEIDHIDGDCENHAVSNLQWLCPDCHCQKTAADRVATRNTKKSASDRTLRERLLRDGTLTNECCECGRGPTKNDAPLTLQLDHIDGDHFNNDVANLRIMCPNCHYQTPTHRGRNKPLHLRARRGEWCSTCDIRLSVVTGSCLKCDGIKRTATQTYTCKDCPTIIPYTSVRCASCKEKHKKRNTCIEPNCGAKIGVKATRCKHCSNKIHRANQMAGVPKRQKIEKKCIDCGTDIDIAATRCVKCKGIATRKIARPSYEELKARLATMSQNDLAREMRVSQTNISWWMKRYEAEHKDSE